MKKYIIPAAAALLCSVSAVAAIEEEVMIVKLADGTSTEILMESVESVSFGTRVTYRDFVVTDKKGHATVFNDIAPLYRVISSEAGEAAWFGCGTGSSGIPAELPLNSEYGVMFSLSPLRLYTADVDLANDKDSYSITLLRYEDGAVAQKWSDVVGGSLTTAMDRKTRKVTVNMHAEFDEGITLDLDLEQLPVDVESLDGMNPAHVYVNEAFYYDADGKLVSQVDVVSARKSGSSTVTFTFEFGDNQYLNGEQDAQIILDKDLIDSVEPGTRQTFNLADGCAMRIRFGSVQLGAYPPDHMRYLYSNIADNGTFTFGVDEDGTYHFFLDVVNTYTTDTGFGANPGGTPEHVIFNYDGQI